MAEIEKLTGDSDYTGIYPLVCGVKHVYIHVHYVPYQTKAEEAKFPLSLHRENIEALLLQLFKQRFSSTTCSLPPGRSFPKTCNDQPVTLLSDQDYYYTYKSKRERHQPGSLDVEFQVMILGPDFDGLAKSDPVAAIDTLQWRRDFSPAPETGFPYPIPTTLSDDVIRKLITSYIVNRIR